MTVEWARDGRTFLIRMNRPHKRNAIDAGMTAGLDAALNEFEDDPELWAAVLTGAGTAFSAGTDLAGGPGEPTERGGEYGLIRRRRHKPMIAAVEGHALGGGMEIVLACDLVVAAHSASFGLPESRYGVIPTCGGLFRTQRALPLNVAKEMLLTGDRLTAERAHQLGFVNALTEEGGALQGAVDMAARICRNAPISIRESLTAVERVNSAHDAGAWHATEDAITATLSSRDTAERHQRLLCAAAAGVDQHVSSPGAEVAARSGAGLSPLPRDHCCKRKIPEKRRLPRPSNACIRLVTNRERKPDAGYQSSSLFSAGPRGTVIAFWRQYFRTPAGPPTVRRCPIVSSRPSAARN